MAGAESGWTVDTLREHLVGLLAAHALLDERRFEMGQKALADALITVQVATDKAAGAIDQRLEGMNEFRAQLSDQVREFLPRREYDARHQQLEDRVTDVMSRLDRMEGTQTGESDKTARWIAGLSALGAVGAVIAVVAVHH